ncbi:MAG: hypothetical protein ACXADD_19215 [Candidatus Thorarchaeota archaeon]
MKKSTHMGFIFSYLFQKPDSVSIWSSFIALGSENLVLGYRIIDSTDVMNPEFRSLSVIKSTSLTCSTVNEISTVGSVASASAVQEIA